MDDEPKNGRREYSDIEILEAIESGARTTPEIADELGCTRQAAGYRLRKLHEQGHVEKDSIGPTNVWELTDK